jgi:hypothetical protein
MGKLVMAAPNAHPAPACLLEFLDEIGTVGHVYDTSNGIRATMQFQHVPWLFIASASVACGAFH